MESTCAEQRCGPGSSASELRGAKKNAHFKNSAQLEIATLVYSERMQDAQQPTTPNQEPEGLAAALAKVAELNTEVTELRVEIKFLRGKLDALAKKMFGASSEALDPAQLLLMLAGLDPKAEEPVEPAAPQRSAQASAPRSRKKREPRTPDNLRIFEERIVPEPVKSNPDAWRLIGEERTELLDYQPAEFFKRHIIREKYVRKDHPFAAPIIARLDTMQERCIAAPGLVAAVVVGKFCDHLPLYRQERIFATRHDVHIPRQTLAQWMALAADLLVHVYNEIHERVLEGGYVQVDETVIKYLSPGHGTTKQGYLWVCAKPGGDAVFSWHTSRAADCLKSLIPAGWSGKLQCDGYSAYPAFVREHNAAAQQALIELGACLAHIRREFYDAKESAPRHSAWLLKQIANLYGIEKQLRDQRAGPRLRLHIRETQSRPIFERLYKAIEIMRPKHLPQSAFGKAMTYASNQRPELEQYLMDGRIEIDNNLVENAIRPTAIGKKNFMFFGSAEAGQRGAILYTIVESCRRRGIDPLAYLSDVLTRLPSMKISEVKNITPSAWAKTRHAQEAPRRAA
jgi:transposase